MMIPGTVDRCIEHYNAAKKTTKRRQQSHNLAVHWSKATIIAVVLLLIPFLVHAAETDRSHDDVIQKMIRSYVISEYDETEEASVRRSMHDLFGETTENLDEILNQVFAETTKQEAPKDCPVEDTVRYADKYIHLLNDIVSDEACLSGEFDVTDDGYDANEAIRVFEKCKLLVLRNVFSPEDIRVLEERELNHYLMGLKKGRISTEGTTTNGEAYHFASRGSGRYEILLPRRAVRPPELLMQEDVMNILQDPTILGQDLVLHSAGINLAESQAIGQEWHFDELYLFGYYDAFQEVGVAGHDMASYAVTVSFPLLDMSRSHGPTEFCIGSSALQGLPTYDVTEGGRMHQLLRDKSLLHDPVFQKFVGHRGCHPDFWRSPTVNKGDILLFDYQIDHRGGWNLSDETRAVMFLTYSRAWFKDRNFRERGPPGMRIEDVPLDAEARELYSQLVTPARFANPDEWEDCNKENGECDEERAMDVRQLVDISTDFDDQAPDRDDTENAFLVSNKDVGDEATQLYLNDELINALPPGSTAEVNAKYGDVFELRSDMVSKRWNAYYQGQVMFSSDM